MDFTDKELKILLHSLYQYRSHVSGASQSEQNKLEIVETVVTRIEAKVGPLKAEKTSFDREMEKNLAVVTKKTPAAAKEKAAKAPAKTTAKKAEIKPAAKTAPAKKAPAKKPAK